MPSIRRIPGRLSSGHWLPLLLVGMAGFCAVLVFLYVTTNGLFDYIGGDYRVYRTSAEIAVTHGFAGVYDLALQDQYQRPLYNAYTRAGGSAGYAPIPLPYPPAFVLLFLPLLLLPPVPAFCLWTLVNVVGLGLYLRRFFRALGHPVEMDRWLLFILAFPAFFTFFVGQVNVLLVVALGEFYLAVLRGRDWAGGAWLAGLLVKPQLLILLIPGLLLGRRFKTFSGFALAGLVLLSISLLLAGPQGLLALLRLVLLYPGDLATTVPNLMMNWRSLFINLSLVLPPWLAMIPAAGGFVLSVGAGLLPWLRRPDPGSPAFALTLLVCCAATCTVAWHSHVHMALLLAIPLAALTVHGRLPPLAMAAWAVVPLLIFVGGALLAPAIALRLLGLGVLIVNAGLAAWAVKAYLTTSTPDPSNATCSNCPSATA